jgi:hypothetical protein
MRLGAPRRLLTSRQGRTAAGAGFTPDELALERRRVGQSSGERGSSRRESIVRLAAPCEGVGAIREPAHAPKLFQSEQEADHEPERERMKGHNDPRYKQLGGRKAPRVASIRRVYQAVKRLGETSDVSTIKRGITRASVSSCLIDSRSLLRSRGMTL